ncbi:cutinase 1 [Cordyceps militaris]|uniref:cutinase n=1 Tax=Cordyceps militaris TaxID=73501 RepID=A0A2H4S5Z9_CORMI|nr:cutinase 1 [Cordyceps militaris]
MKAAVVAIMKSVAVLFLAVAASGWPVERHQPTPDVSLPVSEHRALSIFEESPKISARRQKVEHVSNDFLERGCADVIVFFARGTWQKGNIGHRPGPGFSTRIKDRYGWEKVHVQGVKYAADLLANLKGLRTDNKAIKTLQNLVTDAVLQCDNSHIVVAGYSQGSAVVHAALSRLGEDIHAKIAAAVTFGDTMIKKNKGRIPNFPLDKMLSVCNEGDIPCGNGRMITLNKAHTDYNRRSTEGAQFIFDMLDKAGYTGVKKRPEPLPSREIPPTDAEVAVTLTARVRL